MQITLQCSNIRKQLQFLQKQEIKKKILTNLGTAVMINLAWFMK